MNRRLVPAQCDLHGAQPTFGFEACFLAEGFQELFLVKRIEVVHHSSEERWRLPHDDRSAIDRRNVSCGSHRGEEETQGACRCVVCEETRQSNLDIDF